MTDRIIYKVIPLTLLILTVLLLAGYGLSNYTTLLNSDSYSYLIYARSLAAGSLFGEYPLYDIFREYWPASGRVNLHSGNRHLDNGRICYGVDIGYPLLLALAIVVGGLNAVHFVGPLFLIILSLAFFMLARMVFSDRPDRNILALIGLLVVLLLPPGRVLLSSIKIMRDIPPLTFLVISLFFLISGRERERGGGVRIFLAALFLGLASLVRINYAVCIGPFYLYLLAPSRKRKPWRKGIVRPLVFSLVGFLSLLIPVVLIDIKINRSIFYTVRIVTNSLLIVSSSPTSLFSLTYLGRSGIWYLDFILRTYSLPLLVISLAGVIYGIRRRAVSLLFLPLLICQFIVFAVFKYKQARYLMPVYLILSFFIGYGAVVILQRIADLKARLEGRGRGIAFSRILLMAAGGIVLVGAVLAYLSPLRSGPPIASLFLLAVAFLLLIPHRYRLLLIRYQYPASVVMLGLFLFLLAGILPLLRLPGFQLRELDRFKEEIEEYTPPGSLVLSARFLKQNIDMYTHCYSLNHNQLAFPWKLTMEQSLQMVMDTGVPVFCLDNRGYKDAAKFLPALEKHFQLRPVKKWSSEELGIHRKYISERSYLQLYRVLPWREKEVSIRVPTGFDRDRILAVDLRSLWKDPARNEVRVFLNDHRLSGTVVDNLNYIFLDHRLTSTPQSIVRFASDRGLPGDIPVVLNIPVEDGLTIDLGRKAAPSDILFQDGEFFSTSRTGRYRTMDRIAGIKIPTANIPGRVGYLKIKVRNNLGSLSPVYLNLDLHRRSLPTITIPPEYRWTVVEKRFPAGEDPVSTSWLTLRAIPVVSSSEVERTRAEKGILSIDWLAIEWRVAPTKSELNFNSRTK